MSAYGVMPGGVSTITPTSRRSYINIGKIEVADGATGFAAFALPAGSFISRVFINSTGANTTQTINVGFTSGGTDLVNAFAPNSTGFSTPGAQTGTAVGTLLTQDKVIYLKASATLTTPVFVQVEYWYAPSGMPF